MSIVLFQTRLQETVRFEGEVSQHTDDGTDRHGYTTCTVRHPPPISYERPEMVLIKHSYSPGFKLIPETNYRFWRNFRYIE